MPIISLQNMPFRSCSLVLLFLLSSLPLHQATEQQCQIDCQSPGRKQILGPPTRPWHEYDPLGNRLSLTRPHPYSLGAKDVTAVTFNVTLRMHMPEFSESQDHLFGPFERFRTLHVMKHVFGRYSSMTWNIVGETPVSMEMKRGKHKGVNFVDLTLEAQIIAEHNGYNSTTTDDFFEKELMMSLEQAVALNHLTSVLNEFSSKTNATTLKGASLSFPPPPYNFSKNKYVAHRVLETGNPNPYSPFCELGCTFFFSASDDLTTLKRCTEQCDDTYRYNITVEYNDLVEIARLECRDGCQLALKRCQPGYYCQPITFVNRDESDSYSEGIMSPCPAGTFRDVSYGAVEECIPCPPGRYRETMRGRSLDGCTKCPVGTYASHPRNTSVRDCLRCPAGRFNSEKGAGECQCITPDACMEEQLPCPADAEKRETVPFIGLW